LLAGITDAKYENLANAVGTPCYNNLSDAKLDILVFIDITANAQTRNLFQSAIQKLLSTLTLKNGTDGSGSCVRLYYYYGSDAYSYFGNTFYTQECADYNNMTEGLKNISQLSAGYTYTYSVYPLYYSQNIYRKWESKRQKVILLTQGTNAYYDTDAGTSYADILKKDGVSIITILSSKYPRQQATLSRIATPGHSLNIYEDYFDDNLYTAFTNTLCSCPRNTTQLSVFDPTNNHVKNYGDCFKAKKDNKVTFYAERDCEAEGGSLAALTSQGKFDFVYENVVTSEFGNVKEYNIGLHRSTKTKQLSWYYYDKEEISLSQYHKWAPENKNATGYCGYVKRFGDFQYGLDVGACNRRAPYVCQIKPN